MTEYSPVRPPDPIVPITTNRLRLRALRADDLGSVFDILGDGITTAQVSWRQPDLESTRRWLEARLADEKSFGLSMWAVELQATNSLVGLAGFFPKVAPEVELGYVIHASYWRRGYATESVTAAVQAVQDLPVRVYATIRPWNEGSLRVARHAGLAEVDRYTDDRGPMLVFR